MGKSYKHTPVIKESTGCKVNKWWKRFSNKKVRKYNKHITNGCDYKKIFCSWMLCDYKFYRPWNVETQKDYSKKEWSKYYYWK